MSGMLIAVDTLQRAAARRGLSLTGLFAEAGVARNTLGKITRGELVQPMIGRRLEDALNRIPELEHVEVQEAS